MDILTISLAVLAVLCLIVVWSAVSANNARVRRIDAAKERKRTREVNITVLREPAEATITYDTSAAGLEVDEDLTEEQANVIRMIFEDEHPKIIIRNHKEDYWATTEPASFN